MKAVDNQFERSITLVELYQPADYNAVVALYKNKAAYGGTFDAARDTSERLLATAEAGNVYVAREAGKVVGSFMILDNPHSFWLLRFAVDPALSNAQEVAAVLSAKALEIAKQRGHSSVIAYTDNEDVALGQRYEQLGYHKASNYRCYWKESNQ